MAKLTTQERARKYIYKEVLDLYNDFSTESKKEVGEKILEKGGKLSKELDENVDYILVGGI